MTEQTTAIHAGSAIALKSPHACACATSARPTAVVGMTRRIKSVSTTTTPRLLGQRTRRPIACLRRGPTNSQNALAAKTPPNAPRRVKGSLTNMGGGLRGKGFLVSELYFFYFFILLYNFTHPPLLRHNSKKALLCHFA